MIYFEGLESVIESVYITDDLDNKVGGCDVFVNPLNVKYLTGKIVILNNPDYPDSSIDVLSRNGCHIISRTFRDRPDLEVQPYILRLNFDLMWNGMVLQDLGELDLDTLLDKDICRYDILGGVLYFPKIYNTGKYKTTDTYGNLTAIGWALQEVGINIKQSTVFENLDILKTGKVIF